MTNERCLSTHGANRDLIHELETRHAAFLIVGGAAVAFYGCRTETHLEDIDLLLEPTTENAERAIAALTAAGVDLQFLATDLAQPGKRVPVHTWCFDVDILTPRPDETFSEFASRSTHAFLNDVAVRMISLPDLIAMKRIAAIESTDAAKHTRDLQCLVDKLGAVSKFEEN